MAGRCFRGTSARHSGPSIVTKVSRCPLNPVSRRIKVQVISDYALTHWGRVTHICVSKLTIIGSDNGLSPGRRQAIIWTNAGKLLIRPLGTNFNEMLIEIHSFSLMKMRLKVSSAKWRPFCLGLNVLKQHNFAVKSWYGNAFRATLLLWLESIVDFSHKEPVMRSFYAFFVV